MGVRVISTLDDLASAYSDVPDRLRSGARRVARNAAEDQRTEWRRISRSRAGPHGERFYKRITSEATGPAEYEVGPEGIPKSEFVGVGYRSGGNDDGLMAADLMTPRFHRRVEAMITEALGG